MNQLKKVLLVAAFTVLSLVGCGEKQTSDISAKKVAVIAPMTGPASVYGEWIQHGIEMAITDGANAVKFNLLDSMGDPKTAATLAQKAIADDSTIALWVVTSGDMMALRDVAMQYGLPLITSTATSPAITDGRKGIFRTIVNSAQETEALVRYATEKLKPKKVAVLYINDAGGKASSMQFTHFFEKNMIEVVYTDSYEKNPHDLRTLAAKALSVKPDAVVITGYSSALGGVLTSIREQSPNIPILCNQGLESPENLALPPKVLTGVYYSIAYVDSAVIPERVRDGFNRRYGKPPGLYEITAYDTATLVSRTVAGGAVKRELLVDALSRSDFKGVNGDYRFSKKGNVMKSVAINHIVNGNISLAGLYSPTAE